MCVMGDGNLLPRAQIKEQVEIYAAIMDAETPRFVNQALISSIFFKIFLKIMNKKAV